MTDNEMRDIYIQCGSLARAAKVLRIDQYKLRRIRQALDWPRFYVGRPTSTIHSPRVKVSIYDAVEGGVLTQEQLNQLTGVGRG
jgi:hypothetical protein